jgi:glycosyltransferase involved in cell wall biosynthesis
VSSLNLKAVCLTLWFPKHNNIRYEELLARLSFVVTLRKVSLSRNRIIRAAQYQLWNLLSRRVIYPAAIRYLARKYDLLFTGTSDQISAWPKDGSVIVDLDDPDFTAEEVSALNLPQVKAVVVTTEKAKKIFQELGVASPIHVIPQGVSIEQTDPTKVEAIKRRYRNTGDVIVGYHAPSLTMAADTSNRSRGDQDDLDFLFAVVEEARQMETRIKLWLIGEPSEGLKQYVSEGRKSWVELFGYVPFSEVLNYLRNVDIGVYPRTWNPPPARASIKIAQFMACGIPIVARNLDESLILTEARCGIVCNSVKDFSRALVDLAQSTEKRTELGNTGRAYAQSHLDWSVIVPIYKDILMS